MAYTPTLWAKGDKVTSAKLNKIEQGIVDKVDKETGKTLSTNDFTDAYKTKLDGIEANADKTKIDATLTNSGAAADAKATGNAIKDIENDLDDKVATIESDLDDKVATIESDLDEKVENLKSLVGTPLKATTASAMTDTNKIYVYTGNESGYTNGDWYYHDGSAWVDGGTYNSVAVEVDKTLTVDGMPADANATGDAVNELSGRFGGCQIINSISEMNTVTADKVLVLHNDSNYGDGNACWFEYLDYATEGGYARKDGGKMYPMLDQGALLTSDPPVEKMMGLMASYLENDALVYGNDHTLFDSETTNEIDCSSFVSAILHGISYNSSKYTTGSSTRRVAKVASYSPLAGSLFGHLKTRYMAQFFAERKWLHSMPTTYQMRNVLQFGDILFSWDGTETAKNRYLEIGHVSIVLGIVNNTYVIVAQCGGYPSEVTIKNNSTTVGKISTIALSSDNISKYFRAFARVPYINEHDSTVTGNMTKPILIPNIFVDGDRSGELSSSNVCATSYGYIGVLPNSVITFTGETVHNGNDLTALVAEYDDKFKYLSKTNFTTNPKTLSASTRYIRLCYSHPAGSDIPMLLDDCNQFEATILDKATGDEINEINALKSGFNGLKEDFTALTDGITQPAVGVNIFDNDFDQSGYYDHGAEASGSNFARTSKFYEIADGTTTLYSYHTADASTCNYVFYDAEKVWLANRSFNSAQTSVVVPTGAKYFRVYKHISLTDPITIAYVSVDHYIPFGEGYALKDGSVSYDKLDAELQEMINSGGSALAETVAEHTSTLNQITRATTSPNIFDGNFDESGLINSNGSNESNSNYKRTSAYYEIGENSGSLYVILTATTAQFRLRFYGADNSYKGTGACNNLLTTVISIPTDVTKFRVYTASDFSGDSCISVTPQSEYVPYGSGKALAEDLVDYEALDDDLKEKVGGWLKGKTIAFMGDSIVGNFYDATGICALLAEKTGATVHNCAFGGTQMALRNSEIQNVQYWNALSGYSMSDAIASGDFTAQQTAVDNITGGIAYFKSRLAYIKTIDWDAVDIIMWEYGTNDFSNGNIPIKDTSDLTNVYSYYGAYCHAIETILTAYPHIRIVPVTPLWRYWQDSQNDNAYLYGSDEHEIGGQLLPNFAKCVIEIANMYHLPVIDDYFGLDANKWTRGQYFDVTDSVHPNANGRARIANRLAHILPTLL